MRELEGERERTNIFLTKLAFIRCLEEGKDRENFYVWGMALGFRKGGSKGVEALID